MTRKRIYWHPGPGKAPELMAEVAIDDSGRVTVNAGDPATKHRLEDGFYARGQWLTTSDGEAFFESLELAYANSHRVSVRAE